MRDVVRHVVDDGEFFEVHEHYARNIIVGFARLDGRACRDRRQPAQAPRRRARHRRVDQGGPLRARVRRVQRAARDLLRRAGLPPGTNQERGGIIRHGAKLLYAFTEATVPKVTIITRKAYGGAYDVMASKHILADFNFAWPSAEVAVMGPEGAVNIIHRRDITQSPTPDTRRAKLIDDYRARFANPYAAAERGYLDEVIIPHETRRRSSPPWPRCRPSASRGRAASTGTSRSRRRLTTPWPPSQRRTGWPRSRATGVDSSGAVTWSGDSPRGQGSRRTADDRLTMRRSLLPVALMAGALTLPAAASADVTLQPDTAPAGQFTRLDVRVPTERSTPRSASCSSCRRASSSRPTSPPGMGRPGRHTKADRGRADARRTMKKEVSRVSWTARSRTSAIPPGAFQDFGLAVRIPDGSPGTKLTFNASQTYQGGQVVHWDGSIDSDTPAPQVTLSAARRAPPCSAPPRCRRPSRRTCRRGRSSSRRSPRAVSAFFGLAGLRSRG